jgi:hypothetical protein
MGGAGSDLRRGFYWGILILLLLPAVLASFIFYKVFRATRRKSQLEAARTHA